MAARVALTAVGGSVLAFLVIPVLSVIPMSFSSSMVFELIPSAPGLTQYQRFFSSSEWMLALGRSVQVALGTTVVATTLGTLAALGLVRIRSRWRAALEAALISSRIVPSIVFAVAAYFVFSHAGLVGTITGLVLAHSVLAFPFVVVLVSSALYGLRPLARGGVPQPRRRTDPHVLPHHVPADPPGRVRRRALRLQRLVRRGGRHALQGLRAHRADGDDPGAGYDEMAAVASALSDRASSQR